MRIRKDGSTFEAEVVLTALRDTSGNIRGYSKVTRDITNQIRSREFEAEKIAAEKAAKAKDDFLAALRQGVVHGHLSGARVHLFTRYDRIRKWLGRKRTTASR